MEEEEAAIEALKLLLDQEGARVGREAARSIGVSPPPAQTPPQMSLDAFLLKTIERGGKRKEDIRDAAVGAGYFKGGESPGRVVHAKLLAFSNQGRIRVDDTGIFHSVPQNRNTPSLLTEGVQ